MEDNLSEEEAIGILRRHSSTKKDFLAVLAHSRKVSEIACRLAEDAGLDVDFVRSASLLHDIGRFRFPPGAPDMIRHGIEGYRILMEEGLPRHAMVARNHIGVGVSKEDVKGRSLPLPEEDMVPTTPEEMIIAYADNLEDHGKEMDEAWVEKRFADRVGKDYLPRVKEFHKKVHTLIRKKA